MIGYVTLGTNDLVRAAQFYDELLKVFGAKRFMENDRVVAWQASPDRPGIGVCKPFDGNPATVGNGSMVALPMTDPEQVDSVHAKALELGASDEGAPGFRFGGFYAGYFRDLDGNKLAAFCIVPEEQVSD